jgi:hypothetical protein
MEKFSDIYDSNHPTEFIDFFKVLGFEENDNNLEKIIYEFNTVHIDLMFVVSLYLTSFQEGI